jgi:signal peptidase II
MSEVTMTTPPNTEPPQPGIPQGATKTRDYRLPLLLLSGLIILLDRLSKDWIVANVPSSRPIVVIPGVFRITHVINTGAAFSLLENLPPNGVRIGLILFSILAAVIVFTMLWRTGRELTMTSVALALILGGALGNLYDRVRFHHVVDFLAVKIVHYNWPDFNVADSCIVIGACLLLLEIFRPEAASA